MDNNSQPFQQQSFDGDSSEINMAIEFFIKNKDNFFTQNVDMAKVWMEYLSSCNHKELKILSQKVELYCREDKLLVLRHPSVRHSSDTSPQVEALGQPASELFLDMSKNLIEITEKVKTSTEPQINYNSDIEDSQQFLYEFIRTFCFGKDINSLFQPVVWKSKNYRNLFTNLAIQTLSSNKELLKRYLIEIISDVDNLILGFSELSQTTNL